MSVEKVAALIFLIGLGINTVLIIGSIFLYLCMKVGIYITDKRLERKREKYMLKTEKERKIAIKIIEEFEKLLSAKDIKIPNEERENNEDEACIYGSDYYELEDTIIEILVHRKEVNT